jgi:hypothetical protein
MLILESENNETKSMKFTSILILILLITSFGNAQETSKDYAIIEFIGEKSKTSRSYLGKLKKGELYQLNDYLQQEKNTDQEENTNNYAPVEYNSPKKKAKDSYLSDSYKINEKKLKKGNKAYYKRYLKKKKKAYTKKNKSKRVSDYEAQKAKAARKKTIQKKTPLSKQFKIKGKRLKAGTKFKYPEGNITLIIKYTNKSNNTVKAYVTTVNSTVHAGEKYILKYFGNESKRKYFLTKAQ